MKRAGSFPFVFLAFGWLLTAGRLPLATAAPAEEIPRAPLRVATFRCDVTPPLGRFYGGWMQPLTKLEAPLWAKGIVLESGPARYVVCAVDWCELSNSAHSLFCRKLAEAAGTNVSRVAVQCVHQHTAPYVDRDAQVLLDKEANPPQYADLKALDEVAERLAGSVRRALGSMEVVDRIGAGQAKAERIAATRRVPGPDGKVRVRWSACTDPELRAAAEGNIDPMLKTITLARGDRPLVRLHYYATHPQSGGGDGRIGIDFVGDARERMEKKEGVVEIYFTGCSGDVTAGKYNDGSPQAREELAGRLLAAMESSIASTRLLPIREITWRTVAVRLPARSDKGYGLAENRAMAANPKLSLGARAGAASRAAFHDRADRPIELSLLAIDNVRIVHLPGEPMIEFQQYVQRLLPKEFVAVAGYGDGGPGYLCTEESFAYGGYEPTATMVAPQGETALKTALRELVTGH